MQTYANVFLLTALSSWMFTGKDVTPDVHRVGRIALWVFGALFLASEGLALAGIQLF